MQGTKPGTGAAAFLLRAGRKLAKVAAGGAGCLLVILLVAGFPLLLDSEERAMELKPAIMVTSAAKFLGGLGDGSSFWLKFGNTSWDFRKIGLRYARCSFLYTAVPGALGLGLGAFAGIALRRGRQGLFDRFSNFVLGTPDFLVILFLQGAVGWAVKACGFHLHVAAAGARLAVLPVFCMAIFPFFFAYRAASQASRSAEGESFIVAARGRGVPERSIAWRHLGAVVLPRLDAELPLIIAFMQGSLFITERTFLIPGLAKFLFDSAFAGERVWLPGTIFQYNPSVLALVSLVLCSAATYLVLRLALFLARKVLTHE